MCIFATRLPLFVCFILSNACCSDFDRKWNLGSRFLNSWPHQIASPHAASKKCCAASLEIVKKSIFLRQLAQSGRQQQRLPCGVVRIYKPLPDYWVKKAHFCIKKTFQPFSRLLVLHGAFSRVRAHIAARAHLCDDFCSQARRSSTQLSFIARMTGATGAYDGRTQSNHPFVCFRTS